eukprot:2461072-Rhodomonas_salina.3
MAQEFLREHNVSSAVCLRVCSTTSDANITDHPCRWIRSGASTTRCSSRRYAFCQRTRDAIPGADAAQAREQIMREKEELEREQAERKEVNSAITLREPYDVCQGYQAARGCPADELKRERRLRYEAEAQVHPYAVCGTETAFLQYCGSAVLWERVCGTVVCGTVISDLRYSGTKGAVLTLGATVPGGSTEAEAGAICLRRCYGESGTD